MRRFVLASITMVLVGVPLSLLSKEVTTASLLEEMHDLGRLARWPSPAYRTIQYSSYDRRSTTPEAPSWFSNSDGFGREPIPNFEAVLRKPDGTGIGEYLVADVEGPGAIVRGWSAAMGGKWRVYLDESTTPIWEDSAYEFLARRSLHYMKQVGMSLDTGDAFVQQDADYFPIPFAGRLRVTWEGPIDKLHFYHLQVRLYEEGTRVRTFDKDRDVRENRAAIERAATALTKPESIDGGVANALEAELPAGASWGWEHKATGPGGAITELVLTLKATDVPAALRGVLLRLTFDGAGRPHVESPVGDLFASGPGVNPIASLPVTVQKDGTMTCRFVMPFRSAARIEFKNCTTAPVALQGRVTVAPWTWDSRSMYFRAKWRADHDLLAGSGSQACDMPYLVARGQGLLVGLATMIVNPTPVPTSSGNWWGEGDEKIFVDDEPTPSTFGTGSEDYYNYSWSRPDLFDHPYCGQPLDSGPANAGYVSNHRWQITDAIPFRRSLAAYMELWHHSLTPGLSYACLAYHYARPGCLDDHRRLMPSDLVVPRLPRWEPVARGGAAHAKFHHLEDVEIEGGEDATRQAECAIASRGSIAVWQASVGDRITITLPIEASGVHSLTVVALHQVAGGVVKAFLDGDPLPLASGDERISLKTDHATRLLNVSFRNRFMEEGNHRLTLECVEAGMIGGDYVWIRCRGKQVAGAVEAETLNVASHSKALEFNVQTWPANVLSAGRQMWVKAVKPGDFIELQVPNPKPGRKRVMVYLTKSWDYGILRLHVNGKPAGKEFNAFSPKARGVVVQGPVDLGVHALDERFSLKATVTGTDPKSTAPHFYFGIDCIVIAGDDS